MRGQGEHIDPQTAWLQTHSHSISLESDGFEDLAFLKPLLEGKRVVQLGENTHGVAEYHRVKARIVQFLHQELGYDVVAFESPHYQCHDADLTAAETSALSTLTSCAYGVWHTQEVLPLFEYLRATRHGTRPLRLAGFDVQPIGNNKEGRPRFLSGIVAPLDEDYAAEVFALDSMFLDVYARGSRDRRTFFRSDAGQEMAEAYDRLAAFLAENLTAARSTSEEPDAKAGLVARQTARSMAWYIRQQSAPTTQQYVERRDQGMAENLTALLDEIYPDRKVVVWGHNFHLRHDNFAIAPDSSMFPDVAARTMGSWIRERYGERVYTVGLYAYLGLASDNSDEVFEIEPAEPGSLEALLHGSGPSALFVDLSQAPRAETTAWMDAAITARYDATTPLSLIPRDQYDAVLLIEVANPPVKLY